MKINISPEESKSGQSPQSMPRWLAMVVRVWKNKWLKFGLRMGCTLLLLAYLLQSVSWSTMWIKLQAVDNGLLSVGVITGLFGVIISAYLWQCLLDSEHIHVDLRKLVNLYLVGVAFNHFLPTGMGGDVVKAYYVGRENKNTTGSTSAVVMSRLTGFLGMVLVSLPAVLIWRDQFSSELVTLFLLSCLVIGLALTGVFLVMAIGPQVVGRWLRGQWFTSVINVGLALRKSMLRPRSVSIAVLFGVVFHASAALNYYCYARALGVGSVPVTFYLVAVPLVSLIAFLPVSINGYGLREGAFVYIFSQMNIYTASAEVSLVLVLLMNVQVLLFGVIGGGIYLAMGVHKAKEMPASVNLSPQELSV